MKKIAVKKLQLKKGVIAQLNKEAMNQAAGGGSLLTCPCITEYPTHPCETIVIAPPPTYRCDVLYTLMPTCNRNCTSTLHD